MAEEHTSDLRNVKEGDHVTIETTAGRTFTEVECVLRQRESADPRSGEIRETTIWQFKLGSLQDLTVSIVEGLKSSPNDPEFPVHKEARTGIIGENDVWNLVGYFESVEIHGPMSETKQNA